MARQKKGSDLVRFGISIPSDLIQAFDKYIAEREYKNRSEAIRDLIREKLVEKEWDLEVQDQVVIGTITYVYDHHKRELVDEIIEIQHDFPEEVIVTQHVHLDHHNCLEVAIVRGQAQNLRRLSYKLQALKGIKHCKLTMTTTGASLS